MLLTGINWGLEALKWKIIIKKVQPISFTEAYRDILAGQAVSANTPNGIGEFAGRVAFLRKGNQLKGIALTVLANFSQLVITLVMGFASLLYFSYENHTIKTRLLEKTGWNLTGSELLSYSILLLFIFITLYLTLPRICRQIDKRGKIKKLGTYLHYFRQTDKKELLCMLLISFIRYTVFVIQYVLLMKVFNVSGKMIELSWMVCGILLVLAIIPSIATAELGIRGTVSVYFLGLLSPNVIGITITATTIWLINRILPALAGSIVMLKLKLNKRKS